ncbi:MAG: tyrosine-type recombinase/integrase [Phycisphaera sp.]|nr:tyrosine-type recombinase/integrase [Phycisphaera sp.]
MPRRKRVPSYRLHKPTGQAVVTIDGKDYYLGIHGSPDSHARYNRQITEWIANHETAPPDDASTLHADLRVSELVGPYLRHAETYYVKNGRPNGEYTNMKDAARPLVQFYGNTRIGEFGPRALKALQHAMVDAGLSRKVINSRINRVRRIFKWGVHNEMVSATVLHALQTVPPLKHGRCDARETEPVRPVSDGMIEAVQPFVNSQVWAMIQTQLYSGMRPGEVVLMRRCDLDMGGKVWLYRPQTHKGQHHGHDRTIFIGPKAQKILKPFFKHNLDACLFSPTDAEADRRQRLHENRKTPMSCGNRPGTNRRRKPKKQPSERYTVQSYRQAIQRACDNAFPHPELSKLDQNELTDEQRDEFKRWRKNHRWHPHQLRHNAGTHLRKEFGVEVARIVLGHRHIETTELYAEANIQKAIEVIRKIG